MELCEMCDVHGPLSEHDLARAPPPNIYRIGIYEVKFENAKNFICNQGTYVIETFQYIECTEPQHFHLLIQSVAELFVGTIDKISRIVTERDINNVAAGPLPPVLPHKIFKLSGQNVSHIIREQKLRLLKTFTEHNFQQLEDEFTALAQERRRGPQFKKVLGDCNH
ncbi:hypothetical protein PsorP6_015261 [Peronosclerospora sorghi]|uniref:Uncharacterized protein n=1 Tax=Peronosclerospora sorghi TaxID=230839 RepID=A0ACC0VSN9_9STRA|nr:hypothetical protein PsorP6_015261 [Peronosclerospora sorghi]